MLLLTVLSFEICVLKWYWDFLLTFTYTLLLTLKLLDQICNSPYCQPYNSYNVSSEDSVLDQLIIPKLIFFFVLITYLIDIVLISKGEILSWSLMRVKGLLNNYFKLVNIVIIVKPTFLCYFSDSQGGILRVWNVSKSSPLTSIKLKMTGFHALTVVQPDQTFEPTNNNQTSLGMSSTSVAVQPPSQPNHITYTLPPARILCTFMDGGVGLYDLGKRKWSFLRDMVSNLCGWKWGWVYCGPCE